MSVPYELILWVKSGSDVRESGTHRSAPDPACAAPPTTSPAAWFSPAADVGESTHLSDRFWSPWKREQVRRGRAPSSALWEPGWARAEGSPGPGPPPARPSHTCPSCFPACGAAAERPPRCHRLRTRDGDAAARRPEGPALAVWACGLCHPDPRRP